MHQLLMDAFQSVAAALAANHRNAHADVMVIACCPTICRGRLGDLLIAVQRTLPHARLGIQDMTPVEALAALDRGEVCLAILPGGLNPRYASLKLWEEPVRVVGNPSLATIQTRGHSKDRSLELFGPSEPVGRRLSCDGPVTERNHSLLQIAAHWPSCRSS